MKLRADRLVLGATKYIGLIPLNNAYSLNVIPKVPVANVLRILAIARESPYVLETLQRLYATDSGQNIFELLVRALQRELRLLESRGLPRDYVRTVEDLRTIRGRVMVSKTVERHWARSRYDMIHSAYFDFSRDVDINRAIYFTTWLVLKTYPRLVTNPDPKVMSDLSRAMNAFRGVKLDRSRGFLPTLRSMVTHQSLPFSRYYLKQLVAICYMLLADLSISLDQAEEESLQLPPIVVNMESAFQSFLLNSLRQASHSEPRIAVWNTTHENRVSLFKRNGQVPPGIHDGFDERRLAEPDFVIAVDGAAKLACDAKYKLEVSRSDVYQAVAHATAFGLEDALLVCPVAAESGESSCTALGMVGTVRVFVCRIPLDAPELDLELNSLWATCKQLVSAVYA